MSFSERTGITLAIVICCIIAVYLMFIRDLYYKPAINISSITSINTPSKIDTIVGLVYGDILDNYGLEVIRQGSDSNGILILNGIDTYTNEYNFNLPKPTGWFYSRSSLLINNMMITFNCNAQNEKDNSTNKAIQKVGLILAQKF